MQLSTFKIFCDLADTGSFSKAAARNSITQSAVSQQIRSLETRFHCTLIERGRRNFALTSEGEAFLEASREIIGIYDNLHDRLKEIRDVVAGSLRISSVYSIGLHELPPILNRFRERFADVDIQAQYRRATEVYSEVLNGEVDVGLVAYPAKRKGLIVETFCRDRMVVICQPSHPLASKKEIQPKDLAGARFVSFQVDLPTRKAVDRYLREAQVAVEQVMEFDNIETVKRVVQIENCVSIVPRDAVREESANRQLAAIDLVNPELWRPLGILLRRNRSRPPGLKHFLALLREGAQPPAAA